MAVGKRTIQQVTSTTAIFRIHFAWSCRMTGSGLCRPLIQHVTDSCRVADWHASLNNKMGGDMKKIQTVGSYFVEVWKAVGMEGLNEKVSSLLQPCLRMEDNTSTISPCFSAFPNHDSVGVSFSALFSIDNTITRSGSASLDEALDHPGSRT